MQILPFVLSAVAALALAPGLRAGLIEGGHTVENYRGKLIACPLGIVIVVAVFAGLGLVAFLDTLDIYDPEVLAVSPQLVIGVALLGLYDDAYSGPSRGWRGHGSAIAKGGLPTGAIKAIGTLALAAFAAAPFAITASEHIDKGRYLLAILILALSTNLFNIVDLRPGRAVKFYVLLLIGCLIGIGHDRDLLFELVGVYLGPILVVGLYDLRERGMLGDTGANLIGAVAGLTLLTTIDSTTGLAIAAAVLAALNIFGEFRSISGVIDRAPGLRHLDSVGRIHARD